MSVLVRESDMYFILSDDATFYFERSQALKGIDGVKKAEFAVVISSSECDIVRIIEAKTSAPNPSEKVEDFDNYFRAVHAKFRDSISVLNVALIKRNQNIFQDLPVAFRKINWGESKIQLYLIVKNHKSSWLPPLNDKLKSELRSLIKCWNIPDVDVKALNEENARRMGIVK